MTSANHRMVPGGQRPKLAPLASGEDWDIGRSFSVDREESVDIETPTNSFIDRALDLEGQTPTDFLSINVTSDKDSLSAQTPTEKDTLSISTFTDTGSVIERKDYHDAKSVGSSIDELEKDAEETHHHVEAQVHIADPHDKKTVHVDDQVDVEAAKSSQKTQGKQRRISRQSAVQQHACHDAGTCQFCQYEHGDYSAQERWEISRTKSVPDEIRCEMDEDDEVEQGLLGADIDRQGGSQEIRIPSPQPGAQIIIPPEALESLERKLSNASAYSAEVLGVASVHTTDNPIEPITTDSQSKETSLKVDVKVHSGKKMAAKKESHKVPKSVPQESVPSSSSSSPPVVVSTKSGKKITLPPDDVPPPPVPPRKNKPGLGLFKIKKHDKSESKSSKTKTTSAKASTSEDQNDKEKAPTKKLFGKAKDQKKEKSEIKFTRFEEEETDRAETYGISAQSKENKEASRFLYEESFDDGEFNTEAMLARVEGVIVASEQQACQESAPSNLDNQNYSGSSEIQTEVDWERSSVEWDRSSENEWSNSRERRLHFEAKATARPRSTTPINLATMEDYMAVGETVGDKSPSMDKIRITLPGEEFVKSPRKSPKVSSDSPWFHFNEENLFSHSKGAVISQTEMDMTISSPKRILIPKDHVSPSTTRASDSVSSSAQDWETFDDVPQSGQSVSSSIGTTKSPDLASSNIEPSNFDDVFSAFDSIRPENDTNIKDPFAPPEDTAIDADQSHY